LSFLLSLNRIDTVVFDKTGTLTVGKPTVTDIIPLLNESEGEVFDQIVVLILSNLVLFFLYFPIAKLPSGRGGTTPGGESSLENLILLLAVTAEQESDHPLARAIQQLAERKNIKPLPLIRQPQSTDQSQEGGSSISVGSGISCHCSLGTIFVGNRKFMKQSDIPFTTTAETTMWNLEIQGKTAIAIANNKKIFGILGIADIPKEEAMVSLKVLKTFLKMDIWMFTGDNQTTAEALANKLEISSDRIIANMLPEDKVNKIKELQAAGKIVAMIGDGINDSPALVQSHLGIAIGAGTQIAMESAQMVLIRSNLKDLVVAFDLAKVVFRRIKINFLWAVVYNFISIPFAAGIWFPWTKMLLPPHYAGLAMALSSISVVISSMLLKRYSVPQEFFDKIQEKEEMDEFGLNGSDDHGHSPPHHHPSRGLSVGGCCSW
jgi:Cu+-exporting ATPase